MSERGSIGATLTVIVVIVLGICITCVLPLVNTAKKADNVSQNSLQTALTNFVNEECNKGAVYEEDFYKLIQEISGPNSYDVEMEISLVQEGEGKKTSHAVNRKNGYTVYYTSQVEETWDMNNGKFELGEGDKVYIYAKNTNTTMGTELESSTNSDISSIMAEATATCTKK